MTGAPAIPLPALDELPPSRRRLVDDHAAECIVFAKAFAKRLMRSGLGARVDFGDYVTDAYIGLVRAAIRFDDSLGVKFLSYARHCMRGEVLDGIRRQRGRRGEKEIPIEIETESVRDELGPRIDRVEAKPGDAQDMAAAARVWWLDCLKSERSRLIVMLRCRGLTMDQIGPLVGLANGSRVSQILKTLRQPIESALANGRPI